MPVGNEDQCRVAVAVAATLARGLTQGFDFARGQILPHAYFVIGTPLPAPLGYRSDQPRRWPFQNCIVFSGWSALECRSHRLKMPCFGWRLCVVFEQKRYSLMLARPPIRSCEHSHFEATSSV